MTDSQKALGWSLVPLADGDNAYSPWRKLHKKTADEYEYSIAMHSVWNDKSKYSFSGNYPAMPGGRQIHDYICKHGETLPSCGISKSKSPAQIASDLNRRLIPLYEEKRALAIKKIQETIAYDSRVSANALALGKAMGRDMRQRKDGDKYFVASVSDVAGCGYGDIKLISDDSVTMDLKSIPVELAAQVGKVLAKWNESHAGE